MRRALLGLYTYFEFGFCLLAFLPVMALVKLVHRNDPQQRVPGRWMRRFGRATVRLSPLWRFKVEGQAPADVLNAPYVVIANHESTADPFLLSFLPWDMRWVAKEELFRAPAVGWLMSCSGDIPLRRGKSESVRAMLDACLETLRAGQPIMIFPEGTRSPDGRLLPFKDGAFRLAIEAQVPLLPVALAGTRACRPKGSRWFGDAAAIARVLEPIPTAGLRLEDVDALKAAARARIEAELPELRARLGLPDPEDAPRPAASQRLEPTG